MGRVAVSVALLLSTISNLTFLTAREGEPGALPPFNMHTTESSRF